MAQNYQRVGWKDHVVDTKTGVVLQQGTPVSESNLNKMDDGIVLAHEKLEGANRQVQNITHGLQLINADVNAPVSLQMEGRTLIPLQNTELQNGNYYILADKKTTITVNNTAFRGVTKFTGVAGKPSTITRYMDFENKVPGSMLENPHKAMYRFNSVLATPSQFTNEITATGVASYERLKTEDGSLMGLGTSNPGEIPQCELEWNIVEEIERNMGRIPRNTLAEKIQWVRDNISNISCEVKAHAGGKLVTLNVWHPETSTYSNTLVTQSNAEATLMGYGLAETALRIDASGIVRFIVYGVASDGTNSILNIDLARCRYTLKSGATLHAPRLPLYEVTKEHYDAALVTWNEEEILRRYPSVEGVQHIQNPYIIAEGENLLPPFSEWSALNSAATVLEPYKVELNATTAYAHSYSPTRLVVPGGTLTLTGEVDNAAGYYTLEVYDKNGNAIGAYSVTQGPIKLPANAYSARVRFTNGPSVSKMVFSNVMLTYSSQKPFIPRNPSHLFIEEKLGAIGSIKDILYEQDNKMLIRKMIEKDYVADGSLAWIYRPSESGPNYKTFAGPIAYTANAVAAIFTKYNGVLMKYTSANVTLSAPDIGYVNNIKELKITVSNTESGFAETYSPLVDEMRAYFNGWKVKSADANNKPTAWVSLVDGTDAPTQTLAYVSANKAAGYIPYKVSYTLANPVTLEVKTDGAISLNGVTEIEVGSGVIIREKINKAYLFTGSGNYEVGNITTSKDYWTKNRIGKVIAVYKGGQLDRAWFTQIPDDNASNGANRLKIKVENFDTTAEYYVTYITLDRNQFTANPVVATATFANNIRTALDDNIKVTEDNKKEISVATLQIYEILKRIKAGGL
ncbi:hypothetical protein ACQRXC_08135 [Niallia taxi]|uniref:hypothetical protein n=1 Tax=Niallia taxi TaxID=2499688 RepID=UPI003F5E980F